MATLATASGFPYPATTETPDVQRDLKALADYLEAKSGPYTAYTPVLSQWTPGNGVGVGAYSLVGKVVHFWAKFTLGTTSAVVSTAPPILTLPVTANASQLVLSGLGSGTFLDTGTASYASPTRLASVTTVSFPVHGTNGQHGTPTATVPFTFAATDVLYVTGSYQAA